MRETRGQGSSERGIGPAKRKFNIFQSKTNEKELAEAYNRGLELGYLLGFQMGKTEANNRSCVVSSDLVRLKNDINPALSVLLKKQIEEISEKKRFGDS